MFADELLAAFVAIEHLLLGVAPKMVGIIIVGLTLAQIAIEIIEALSVGFSSATRASEAPLADTACFVTSLLQEVAECESPGGNGPLAFRGEFAIISNIGVTGMFAGEENASGGRADWTAGVELREAHALGCKPIDVRRFDLRLTVAAEVGVAQVIGKQEDDIGRRYGGPGKIREQEHQQSGCKKLRANGCKLGGSRLQFKARHLNAHEWELFYTLLGLPGNIGCDR
jgi:hypothetical protein